MARRARPRPKAATDPRTRIVDAALELVPVHGWSGLTLARVARATGHSLAELYNFFPTKTALLGAFLDRIDRAMVAGAGADEDESPRDRLFAVMMARFDALKPHKDAVRRIVQDLVRDPAAAVSTGCRLRRSLALMLEAAAIPSGGLFGALRLEGLGLIHLSVLRVWLGDDSDDAAKTMAALDRALGRAEAAIGWCRGARQRGDTEAAGNSA
ncbi:MAG: TetR family transcriptional regulator [Alphaproteobacteria bacterium]|nr:TetR family transcriptional regulator [Alphaproteobacteria bacterium]